MLWVVSPQGRKELKEVSDFDLFLTKINNLTKKRKRRLILVEC